MEKRRVAFIGAGGRSNAYAHPYAGREDVEIVALADTNEFVKMMADPAYRPAQDAQAGYLSAVMCFVADRSMNERRRIDFFYESESRIALQ